MKDKHLLKKKIHTMQMVALKYLEKRFIEEKVREVILIITKESGQE